MASTLPGDNFDLVNQNEPARHAGVALDSHRTFAYRDNAAVPEDGRGAVMVIASSLAAGLLGIFIVLGLLFFAFLYISGRVFGAGVRKGGDLWRSGQHDADRRYGVRPPPTPPASKEGPTEPHPPSMHPGWYEDPWGPGRRYWNGVSWTPHTAA